MMTMYNDRKNPNSPAQTATQTTITLDELALMQHFKDTVIVPKSMLNEFGKLLNKMTKEGIKFSDRKLNWCLDVMKASAAIDGRDTLDFEDLKAVTYILWENTGDIDFIKAEILKLVDPFTEKIQKFYKEAMELISYVKDLEQEDAKAATDQTLEVKPKVEVIINRMDKVISDAKKANRFKDEMETKRHKAQKEMQDLVCKMLGIDLSNPLNSSATIPF